MKVSRDRHERLIQAPLTIGPKSDRLPHATIPLNAAGAIRNGLTSRRSEHRSRLALAGVDRRAVVLIAVRRLRAPPRQRAWWRHAAPVRHDRNPLRLAHAWRL